MFAAARPDNLDFALFVHVAGATVLVGALVTALVFSVSGSPSRLTFRALLWTAVPSWFVMYAGALWIADKEGLNDIAEEPDWLGIGHMTADLSFLFIAIAVIIAGLSARKAGKTSTWVSALISVCLILSLIAIWAMTTKPS